jgi:hypothetical protein
MAVMASRLLRGACAVGVTALLVISTTPAGEQEPPMPAAPFQCPTVPPDHKHVRALLDNALRYAAPGNKMTDPVSGYPYEGWNHDPSQGLYLRSFTQLTAIGLWMELLANVAAGQADSAHLSRDRALSGLAHIVRSLRQDQANPRLGAKGLLGNFLDLATAERLGPLASDVEKKDFQDAFGREKGEAVWKALAAKGWIVPRNNDREAGIRRDAKFGASHFDGPLAPFHDDATRNKVMAILDRRTVMVVFGDNANLSTSAAKTIGALLAPAVRDRPGVADLRRDLEQFLENQRDGYARLYDPEAGLFYFGWDAGVDRLFGWVDLQGKWVTGHADYLVNEFRGPTTFVALRFGIPTDAVKNLGFKIKPYRTRDDREVYVLAPWEGSAFQALGLSLSFNELARPSWRALLENAVDVEIDFSTRRKLPGFLSESYTGNGVEYTGHVGIPEITVSPVPRVTDAASLYTLGVAYEIAPDKVERFLADNWPVVGQLLTDHGPWEGFNVTRKEAIRFQTTSHTLSLILGFLGTGSGQMQRYLDSRGLGGRLADVFRPGEATDLMAAEANVFAWAPKGQTIHSTRDKGGFHVQGDRVGQVGIAFVSPRAQGVNLSGGLVTLRYRSAGALGPAVIDLKPPGGVAPGLIPTQLFTHLDDTGGRDAELRLQLPATPGLTQVKEFVVTCGTGAEGRPVDLVITRLGFEPNGPEDSPRRRGEHGENQKRE